MATCSTNKPAERISHHALTTKSKWPRLREREREARREIEKVRDREKKRDRTGQQSAEAAAQLSQLPLYQHPELPLQTEATPGHTVGAQLATPTGPGDCTVMCNTKQQKQPHTEQHQRQWQQHKKKGQPPLCWARGHCRSCWPTRRMSNFCFGIPIYCAQSLA